MRRTGAAALLVALAVMIPLIGQPPATGVPHAASSDREAPTVLGVRRIGTSVQGRAIRAYHLGDASSHNKAIVLGNMHGDEKAGIQVVSALRSGAPISGVDLWAIPTMNPDGVAHNTRGNAHGVDLNRNFGHHWVHLTGSTYSGTGPWSEPETRAFRRFANDIHPTFIVSFHQPLHAVGRAGERLPFVKRLANGLGLPIRSLNCSGVCHGTMTEWYNAAHRGTAVTVEFGSSPKLAYLHGRATRGTLHAVLGSR